MKKPQALTSTDYHKMAGLHRTSLPTSGLSSFSTSSLAAVYKFAVSSKQEEVFIERNDLNEIIAVALISLAPGSFLKRLMMGSTFPFQLLLGLNGNVCRLIAEKLFDSKDKNSSQDSGDEKPELMFIFSAVDARLQGCGQRLLSQIEGYFVDKSIPAYEVWTEDEEDNWALFFYEKNGFVKDRSGNRSGNKFQILRKDLDF